MDNFLRSEISEVFSIFKKIKSRNFSGNSGAAIRNSLYQISFAFSSKVGSLLFTIILARLLMPELFGLYSIALGTILVFSYFSDLGVGQTLTRFVSKEMSKKKISRAKSYAFYLFKLKFLISAVLLILLLILAKPLAGYYQKPIFLILLSGSLYLFFISLTSFLQSFLQSLNDFKTTFLRETLFQILRLIVLPLLVLYLTSKAVSGEKILIFVFLSFGILWVLMAFFLFNIARKTPLFLAKASRLKQEEKKEVNIFFASLLAFSVFSILFTYSDIFVLGRFVSSEYIGYYQAAMGLIGSLITLVLYSNSLLPVFSRMSKENLDLGFKKVFRLTILISVILFLVSFSFSNLIISILYGKEYLLAVPFFKALSFLLILWPLTALYNGYFIARGEPKVIRNILVFVSLFNLGINFLLVSYLSTYYSNSAAVLGLIIGTIISNVLYVAGCAWKKKKSVSL